MTRDAGGDVDQAVSKARRAAESAGASGERAAVQAFTV